MHHRSVSNPIPPRRRCLLPIENGVYIGADLNRAASLSAPSGYHEMTCNGARRNDLLTDCVDARVHRLRIGQAGVSGAKFCTAETAIQPPEELKSAFGIGVSLVAVSLGNPGK